MSKTVELGTVGYTPCPTSEEVAELARAAGRAGRTWAQFACDAAPQEYVLGHDDHNVDIAIWRAAFDIGMGERRVSEGWVIRWTTASIDYDSFGTLSEPLGDWYGRTLRKVLIHPHHVGWHEGRYGSALGGCWSKDPREEERALAERTARWHAEDERRVAARNAGLAWLQALTDEELGAVDFDTTEAHFLTSADVRAERDTRGKAAAEASRIELWDRCRLAVQDGMILVDDGESPKSHKWGNIPGRDAHIYYNIRLTNDHAGVADEALVVAEGWSKSNSAEFAGSLVLVAEWLASGRLRVVSADAVPPAPVTQRIGHKHYKDIRRVSVEDRVVWVGGGGGLYARKAFVLDEHGRLVRSKRICEAALAAVKGQPGGSP